MQFFFSKRLAAISIAFGVFFSVPQVMAASFNASATGFGCHEVKSGPSPVTADGCFGVWANSELGRFGVAATSTTAVSGEPVRVTRTGVMRATAIFSDIIYFGVSSGSFSIPIDVDGSIFNSNTVGGDGSYASLTGEVRTNQSAGLAFSAGTGSPGSPTSFVSHALLPFTGGSMSLSVVFAAVAKACSSSYLGDGESCSASVDYKSSLRLLGGTLFDDDGKALSGVSVTSDSGFDYLAGYEPHDRPPSPVPVPAAMPLLFAGLFVLGFAGRRRNSRLKIRP